MKRISQLDGIRGLAIAAVIIDHVGQIINIGTQRNSIATVLTTLTRDGWMGVDIFFVLSGFLITEIILKERNRPDFWGNFYLRRAARILPAFAVVFVTTLIATHFLLPQLHISRGYVLAATFFLANWTVLNHSELPILSHIWSLAVEEQFYFLWPQAAKRLTHATVFKLALSLVVLCEVLRIGLTMLHVSTVWIYRLTPTRIDGLSIGAALATGLTLPPVRRFLTVWWRRIAMVALAVLALSFVLLRLGSPILNSMVLGIPPLVITTAMMIYGAIESALPSFLARFFGSSVMTYLGRRSYALYLIHQPISYATEVSRQNGILSRLPQGVPMNAVLIVGTIVVSVILTEISWRLVETPAQNFRRRMMREKVDTEVAAVNSAR